LGKKEKEGFQYVTESSRRGSGVLIILSGISETMQNCPASCLAGDEQAFTLIADCGLLRVLPILPSAMSGS
jgi:hypothetical protein